MKKSKDRQYKIRGKIHLAAFTEHDKNDDFDVYGDEKGNETFLKQKTLFFEKISNKLILKIYCTNVNLLKSLIL